MKMDFLTPAQLPYPAPVAACVGGSPILTTGGYQTPSRDGFLNSLLNPEDLPYPLPAGQVTSPPPGTVCTCTCTTQSPPATGGATTPPTTPVTALPATSNQLMPTASTTAAPSSGQTTPSQIVINVGVPGTSAARPVTSSSTAAATTSPTSNDKATTTDEGAKDASPTDSSTTSGGGSFCKPTDAMVQAYTYNPRLRARVPRAHEQLLEDMLDESLTNRLLMASGAPLAFVVPAGDFDSVEFFAKAPS